MTLDVYKFCQNCLSSRCKPFFLIFSGMNEVKVIVKVTDLNDNVPKFTITGRPIVAAVPASANFGYQIIRLQVRIHKSAIFVLNSKTR